MKKSATNRYVCSFQQTQNMKTINKTEEVKMRGKNKVFLMGNLVIVPKLKFTSSGVAICNFSIAINRRVKREGEWTDEVDYIDVVVLGKQGETCGEYLSKGRGVFIEGRLENSTWETEDGQKRSKIRVVATNVQFLPRSSSTDEADVPY